MLFTRTMAKRNILQVITNGIWMIDESFVGAYAPIIDQLIKGTHKDVDAIQQPAFYSVAPDGEVAYSKSDSAFNSAKPLSTAIISMVGPIMKYDNCLDAGTITYGQIIKSAIDNPNIGSIVLVSDSPGGEVAGTEDFAKLIAESTKPIIGYVDDLAASAAYWALSGTKEIYANGKTARIGSIGTMLSFADAQGAYEKLGYKFHEIYAPASVDKNKDYAEARKGNYDAVKKTLASINDVFISSVIAGRGDKLNQKETLTGKVFMAEDAVKVGLIDGIKSLEEVIARAQELAGESAPPSVSKNQINSHMKIKATWLALLAALTPTFAGVKAGDQFTEEMGEQMNAKLEKLAETEAALETAKTALDAANASKVQAESALATANDALKTAKDEATRIQAEFEAFKKSNPGATETIKGKGSEIIESSNDWEKTLAELPHNKAIDEHPLLGTKK